MTGNETSPDLETSKCRAFGLGQHNFEFSDDELCDKQATVKSDKHFCTTGEWTIDIHLKSHQIWQTSLRAAR